ncbi:uncharacterized protein LOC125780206 isoform X1 [Bactrocera dorsalis]|uniref:Uncharacterized protein LOC125780206 isoform X1 n=1 Tax=Bactrocera dorsalis TaxID=27457 RepID=A0ABM3K903_BACDO|nr:uncharacterized protein LOC125780206 isoform X1 [Bactrocera dorsalis]
METAGKLRRMNGGIPQSFLDSFNDGCDKYNNLQKLFVDKITELGELIEKQNKVIINILAEHAVLLQNLTQKEKGTNGAIDDNRDCYISAVQYLLQGEVVKDFEKVLARKFCLEYNIYGIGNNKSFKDYSMVYTILKKAIGKTAVNAEAEMRRAFQVVKKRHFRQVSSIKNHT